MRLADLKPKWIGLTGARTSIALYTGVSFDCPHCCKKRLAVRFWPPVDPEGWLDRITPIPHDGWHTRAAGESFETLTITPSIGFDNIGHWHGHITNGEVISS